MIPATAPLVIQAATSFGALRNGDIFRIVGLAKTDENLAHRKANATRAYALQDGTWRTMPADWPVYIVDRIVEVAP